MNIFQKKIRINIRILPTLRSIIYETFFRNIFFSRFFRQKLRGAVYDALTERGMKERDPLFRPCFKRLFDICNIFAKDMPPKNQSSTKQWLATVARQNSDSVISLEKSLRVGSK
jgi:hypothetical protein